jgi:NAD(P)-dependent dehydrogenase (short-subunit alcohol dehydrogenase family)
VALITGAGSGICAATAMVFAQEGAKVALADLRSADLAKKHARSPARGGGRPPLRGEGVRRLGWVLLSGRLHAVNDRQADQAKDADPDPLLRDVRQVGAQRQADDQDDVPEDVEPE